MKRVLVLLTDDVVIRQCRKALEVLEGIDIDEQVLFCNNPLEIDQYVVRNESQLFIIGLLNGHEKDTQSVIEDLVILNPSLITARFAMFPTVGNHMFQIMKGANGSKDMASQLVRFVGFFLYELQLLGVDLPLNQQILIQSLQSAIH